MRKCWVLQRGEKKSLMRDFKYFQGSTICSLIRSNPRARVAVGEGSPSGKDDLTSCLDFIPQDFTSDLGTSP